MKRKLLLIESVKYGTDTYRRTYNFKSNPHVTWEKFTPPDNFQEVDGLLFNKLELYYHRTPVLRPALPDRQDPTTLARQILGENIRIERLRLGLTQKEFAEKARISSNTIYRVELGANITFDMLVLLCRAFKIPISHLLRNVTETDLTHFDNSISSQDFHIK